MLKLYQRLRYEMLISKWTWIIVWRCATDRWFIFRDAPNEVCFHFMGMESDEPGDVIDELSRLAEEEVKLRMARMTRDIERMGREVADGSPRE